MTTTKPGLRDLARASMRIGGSVPTPTRRQAYMLVLAVALLALVCTFAQFVVPALDLLRGSL